MAVIIIIIIALLIYRLQSGLYLKKCFDDLSFDLSFKDTGVFEGENTEIAETIKNNKWLPLWWVIIKYPVSTWLKFQTEDESQEIKSESSYRKDLFSAGPYQKITRRFKVTAARRGYYQVNSITLTTGDYFIKYKFMTQVPAAACLYVYPSFVNTGDMLVPFERMMGEVNTRLRLLEDPFLVRGIRDYSVFDNFKKINWNASARSNELKVNEYDYTSSKEVMMLLNVEKFNDWDGDGTIEESIRIVSSVAGECIKSGVPAGLISNGKSIITGRDISIDISENPGQVMVFCRQLALLNTRNISGGFADKLKELKLLGDKQPLYLLVSQYFGKDLQDEVNQMRMDGYNLYWILPKNPDTVLKMDDKENFFVWEVPDR